MVIIKLMGGLGNQLQQYALYLKFISLGREAYLDTSWFEGSLGTKGITPRGLELNLFENADYKKASPEQLKELISGDDFGSRLARKLRLIQDGRFVETDMYHPEIFDMDDVYLVGYWAADKYYADILPTIREKLIFTRISSENKDLSARIARAACTDKHTCSVHIRRGDYLDPENAAVFGNIATESYYDTAFEYMRELYSGTEFYIFTDDMEYVRSRYANCPDCTIVDINHGDAGRFDIYLMSQCDSHICANSTFSFWGARLDDKLPRTVGTNMIGIKIRPTLHKNSQIFVPEVMKSLWPGWTFIDPQGHLVKN